MQCIKECHRIDTSILHKAVSYLKLSSQEALWTTEKVIAECFRHDSNVPHTASTSDSIQRTHNDYKIKIPYACNRVSIFNYHLVINMATYLRID